MSDAELRAKFDGVAIPVLGESRAGQLAAAVATVETLRDVRELTQLFGPVI